MKEWIQKLIIKGIDTKGWITKRMDKNLITKVKNKKGWIQNGMDKKEMD